MMMNSKFNTVKEKLSQGKQVVGGTIKTADTGNYLAMANAGFDFIWIEMQHSPMTYQEAASLIWACKDTPAIPFIRIPDATEGDIQKATDIGALGIIIPMVNSVTKVKNAVSFASYPPLGERSLGGGQHSELWGSNYRHTANENMMVVAQVESQKGVEIVEECVKIEGLDIVMVESSDLSSFSGLKQGEVNYEAMVSRVSNATLSSGRILGGPYAWKDRKGFSFLQAPTAEVLLNRGVKNLLKETTNGFAETEGDER